MRISTVFKRSFKKIPTVLLLFSIILTNLFLPSFSIVDAFSSTSVNGPVSGYLGEEAGVVSGWTSGSYNTTISGVLTEYSNPTQRVSFEGVITGEIEGTVVGTVNYNGYDTLSALITGPSISGHLYLIGRFEGPKGHFVANFMNEAEPLSFVDSINILGGDSVSLGKTLQMSDSILPLGSSSDISWTVWTGLDPKYGNATIDQETGLLTGTGLGEVVVIASALDGSLVTQNHTVTVFDGTGPVVNLVSPVDDYFTNQTSVLQEWTTTDTDVDYYEYRSCSNNPDVDGFCNLIYSTARSTNSRTVNNNNLSFWWQVRAIDLTGNWGNWTEARRITIDTTSPLVDIVSPSESQYVRGIVDLVGNIEDSNLMRYYYNIKNVSLGTTISSKTVYSNSLENETFYTWSTNDYPDGQYLLHLAARDLANNRDATSEKSITVTVDNSRPQGSIESLYYSVGGGYFSNRFTTNSNTPTIFVTALDLTSGIKNISVSIDSQIVSDSTGYAPGTTVEFYATLTDPLADGTYTIQMVLEDCAGNTDFVTRQLVIDTKAPTAGHTYFKNGELVTSNIAYVKDINELSFTGNYFDTNPSSGLYWDSFVIFQAQDDGSFRFSQNGKLSYCSWRKAPNLIELTTYTGEQRFFTDCTPTLPEGNYYMSHQIYDNATRKDIPSINQFRDVLGLNFIVDTQSPTTTFESNYSWAKFNNQITIKGVSTDNHNIQSVFLEAKKVETSTWQTVFEQEYSEKSQSLNWETVWTPSEDGIYNIRAYSKDEAGNVGNYVYAKNLMFDKTPPTVKNIEIVVDSLGQYVNGLTSFIVTAKVNDNLSGVEKNSCKVTTGDGLWIEGKYIQMSNKCVFLIGPQNNNKILQINVSSEDTLGNIGLGTAVLRIADSKLPEGIVDIENDYYGPNSQDLQILGTSSDDVSGVKDVKITIRRDSDNRYWNNMSILNWTKTPLTYHSVTGVESWEYSGTLPMLQNGFTYTITPYVLDNVLNLTKGTSDSFTWDSEAPLVPANPYFDNPFNECGGMTNSYTTVAKWDQSFDSLSGLSFYEYFVDTPLIKGWTTKRSSTSYPGTFNQGEGEYTFKVRAVDNVNNKSNWSNTCSITYDVTKPVLSQLPNLTFIEGRELTPAVVQIEEQNPLEKVCLNVPTHGYEVCEEGLDSRLSEYNLMQLIEKHFSITTVDTKALPAGIYQIEYYAYDKAGNRSDIKSLSVEIQKDLPFVTVLGESSTTVGNQVVLTANTTAGNAPLSYLWTGDCVGDSFSTTFAPKEVGTYTCTVTVIDADGDFSTQSHKIEVGEVFGLSSNQSETLATKSKSTVYTYQAEFLGTGGPDEKLLVQENVDTEQEKDTDKEDIKGIEDVTSEKTDEEQNWPTWLTYVLLAAPVLILVFLFARRRNRKEERVY